MKIILPFYLLFLLISSPIFAQYNGFQVSGTVIDASDNKPIMGVYITTGKLGAQTDSKGRFIIKNVPKGKIVLNTMYFSSYPTISKNIDLSSDTTVNFTLSEQSLLLGDLVVTGTRTEKRLSEVPVLTTVIREREIQKSGASSALESLQDNVPGVVVSPNAMGSNMRIKGLNSRYILFLIDGERMVSEGAGGNINLDQIDVNNIKKIEMINGAASALYGSNAVGAVINIITKEPIHKFEAGANIIAESNNTWRTKIDLGSNLKKISARISGFRNSSDGFGAKGGGAYAARYKDYGSNLNFSYRPINSLEINLIGRYFRHETFNPTGSLNVAHALNQTVAVGVNIGYTSADERNKMKLSVNYDKYLDYDVLEKKNNELKKDNTADFVAYRFVNTFKPNKKFELVGGLEHNHEENFATRTLGKNPTTKSLDDISLFAQADYEIFKNFNLTTGARYTYNTQFKSAFTPKLSLMYSVGDFKFRAALGTAFRAPGIKELYYNFDHQGMFWVYGNPSLKAEKGLYSSLSVEYTKGLFNSSVSAYYNNINNKINQYDVINSSGANEKYYKNVSSATLKGLDVNLSYIFFKELVIKANYSFCDAKDNSTKLQLSSNVRHSGTISATWNGKILRSPFSLQMSGRVNSPILYQEVITNNDGTQSNIIKESKSYSVWKVILLKPFRINKHTIEATFKVDNIFNFKEASFINPGRQYLVGIRYAFK